MADPVAVPSRAPTRSPAPVQIDLTEGSDVLTEGDGRGGGGGCTSTDRKCLACNTTIAATPCIRHSGELKRLCGACAEALEAAAVLRDGSWEVAQASSAAESGVSALKPKSSEACETSQGLLLGGLAGLLKRV